MKDDLREMMRILFIALIIVVPIRLFVAQPFIVRGASMEPNFREGEYLVVDELSYQFRTPRRGDVIILRFPPKPSDYFIKRIVGLPNETVRIADGKVHISGPGQTDEKTLDEKYIPSNVVTSPNKTVVLNPGEYFVLGDNRANSYDSRVWGVLNERYVVGRTLLRLWPLTELSIL